MQFTVIAAVATLEKAGSVAEYVNDQEQRPAAIGSAHELVAVRAVFFLVRPRHEAVPEYLFGFPVGNAV